MFVYCFVTQMCICPDCPSWVEGGEKGDFCFDTVPKSRYISEEKGCSARAALMQMELGSAIHITAGNKQKNKTASYSLPAR